MTSFPALPPAWAPIPVEPGRGDGRCRGTRPSSVSGAFFPPLARSKRRHLRSNPHPRPASDVRSTLNSGADSLSSARGVWCLLTSFPFPFPPGNPTEVCRVGAQARRRPARGTKSTATPDLGLVRAASASGNDRGHFQQPSPRLPPACTWCRRAAPSGLDGPPGISCGRAGPDRAIAYPVFALLASRNAAGLTGLIVAGWR